MALKDWERIKTKRDDYVWITKERENNPRKQPLLQLYRESPDSWIFGTINQKKKELLIFASKKQAISHARDYMKCSNLHTNTCGEKR